MQTGSSAPVYRPPLQQPQSSHGISSTRFATGIRGARIKIASTALNSGMMVLKESTADTMNSDGLGNYTFDEKSDFTDQHDDLMDVTFDPITAPGNDDRYVRSDASDTKSDLVGEYVDATIVSLHVVIVDFVGANFTAKANWHRAQDILLASGPDSSGFVVDGSILNDECCGIEGQYNMIPKSLKFCPGKR
jgi:hypothetical protein